MHALDSAYAKVERAKAHKETLYQEIRRWIKSQSYTVIHEVDMETHRQIWRFRGTPSEPTIYFQPFIGEALYHLRSALDHLAWKLVEVNGNAPTQVTEFPIFEDPNKFRKKAHKKMQGMSIAAINIIKSEQPGIARNPIRSQSLLNLHFLNIIDKHRHFNVVIGANAGGFMRSESPMVREDVFIHSGIVENGTILASAPVSYQHTSFLPVFDIAFGPEGPAAGEMVTSVLEGCEFIVMEILGRCYPFFPARV